MKRWLIFDTHWGHEELQAHNRRPANADTRINKAWRRLVQPEDLLIHGGDVAFTFVNLKEHLDSLPGRKILVRGNHDSHTIQWYMENGFDFACDGLLLGGVYYTHQPVWKLPYGATLNVHGHFHTKYPRGVRYYPNSRLFSLEYENYEPRLIPSFLQSIEKETPFIPPKRR